MGFKKRCKRTCQFYEEEIFDIWLFKNYYISAYGNQNGDEKRYGDTCIRGPVMRDLMS